MTDQNLGPVVRDGRIRFLSPSQIERFDVNAFGGCERKWWFRYVGREKEPELGNQKLGTQCHAQNEHYLKTGEDVLGEIVRAGRRFLPSPGKDLLVEVHFGELGWPGPVAAPVVSPLMAGGIPVIGKADLMHVRGEWVDDEGVVRFEPVPTAEVVDWKTTAQIDDVRDENGLVTKRGYAKTSEQLSRTWQMLGYGELAWQRWPHIERVRLSHGYFQTRGPRAASKRSISLPIAEVRAEWRKVDALVERMKGVAAEKDVEKVAPNYEACAAYRGCPHRQKCPRDPKRILMEMFGAGKAASLMQKAAKKEEVPMSLLAKRKAAAATAPSALAAETTKAIPVTPEVSAEMAALEAEEAAIRAGISPPDQPKPEKITEPHPEGSIYTVPRAGTVDYDPNTMSRLPDGRVVVIEKKVEAASVAALALSAPGSPCSIGGTQVNLDADVLVSKKFLCSCGAAALKIKPAKLGDGKYYGLVPKHDVPGEKPIKVTVVEEDGSRRPAKTEAAVEAVPPASANTGDLSPDKVYAEALKQFGSGTPAIRRVDLYLDALENGVAFKRLENYADELARSLADQYKAADVRCAPEGSPLSFGKWKGALAAVARAQPPEPGAYLCSSSSEVGLVVFQALETMGLGRVVHGVK